MPIYEYFCPDNNTVYRFFARRMALANTVPRCPENPAFRMEKQVSSFAITGATPKAKREDLPGGEDAVDDPRMESAMMEMEREMSGMDEENPDPRQMARMMRRMSEITGESGGERMEEMIRRLEAGEDPDKMEEEFGDVMGDDDGDGMPGEVGGLPGAAGDETGEPGGSRRMLARLRRGARGRFSRRTDSELYELEDYLPS